jgi:predicted phosphodiesterase
MTRAMRVAVLSDVHGHLPARDAVLAEARTAADRIVITRDGRATP